MVTVIDLHDLMLIAHQDVRIQALSLRQGSMGGRKIPSNLPILDNPLTDLRKVSNLHGSSCLSADAYIRYQHHLEIYL